MSRWFPSVRLDKSDMAMCSRMIFQYRWGTHCASGITWKLLHASSLTAHNIIPGHMEVKKAYHWVFQHFFWPCHVTLQVTSRPNQSLKPAPLCPIPAENKPFDNLIMDCVGPLPRSKSGCSYLLTIMCQSTRHPAAYPFRLTNTKFVLKAISGIPRVIQVDQVLNFTSRLFTQVLEQLNVTLTICQVSRFGCTGPP